LPEAVRWDDAQMVVLSRPLVNNINNSVQLFARVFQEEKNTKCRIVVGIDAQNHQVGLNAANSSYLWQNAHLFKARIESEMKARQKKADKK
jgi:hypothetical protein